MVAVGQYWGPPTKKSEKFEDGAWNDIAEPPVATAYGNYAVIFDAGNFYYFGGYDKRDPGNGRDDEILSSILRLNAATWTWSNVGQLNSARDAHNAILVGNTFMVMGGPNIQPNEACLLNNGQFTCEELPSSLDNFIYTALLTIVSDDFGLCEN